MNEELTYIAGPMSGIEEYNFPAFHEAAAKLRSQGRKVINPAEIEPDFTRSWEECMRKDLAALLGCNAVYMLPGWQDSRGASLEHHIALHLGMRIEYAAINEACKRAREEKECKRQPMK